MESIEHVGLPHTIQTNEAVHLRRKVTGRRGYALEVEKMKTLNDHG